MAISIWLVIGLVVGVVVNLVMRDTAREAFVDIALGMAGAFAGGLLFNIISVPRLSALSAFDFVASAVGGVVLIFAFRAVLGRRVI